MDAVALKRLRTAWELVLSYAFIVSTGLLLPSASKPELVTSLLGLWAILFIMGYLWGSYDLEVGPAFGIRLRTEAVFVSTFGLCFLLSRLEPHAFLLFPLTKHAIMYWVGLLLYLNVISPLLAMIAGLLARVPALCVFENLSEDEARALNYWGYQCLDVVRRDQLAEWLKAHCNERHRLSGVEAVLLDMRHSSDEQSILTLSRLYFCDFVAVKAMSTRSYLLGENCRQITFMPMTGLNRRVKRLSDIVLSILFALILSPFLLVIAIIIKLETHGPVLYKHRRLGKDMRYFWVYKFRTMYKDADQRLQKILAEDPALRDEFKSTYKLKNDPRVTPIGRFLRKTSLDEIPQLLNVIKDQMSLVGPRPIVDGEIPFYKSCNLLPFRVMPGATGLWQISGRNDTSYDRRVELDVQYVSNWSYLRDIKILFGTIAAVLRSRGAY